MDNLIAKELQAAVNCEAFDGDVYARYACGKQMKEAANEIEKLEAENERLREGLKNIEKCGHYNECLFCARKDVYAAKVLGTNSLPEADMNWVEHLYDEEESDG